MPNPTYKQVKTGETGHAESVRVVFDPSKVKYETLCTFFMHMIDPTQLNRQGVDKGTQYRNGIYTVGDAQFQTATQVVDTMRTNPKFDIRKIVTEIEPAREFYVAEDYH